MNTTTVSNDTSGSLSKTNVGLSCESLVAVLSTNSSPWHTREYNIILINHMCSIFIRLYVGINKVSIWAL